MKTLANGRRAKPLSYGGFFFSLLYLLLRPELAVGELQTSGYRSGDQWFGATSATEVSINGPSYRSDNGDPKCTWALEIPATYTFAAEYSLGPESGTYNVTRVKDRAYENISGGGGTCALVAVTGGTNIEEIGEHAFSSGALEDAIFSSGRLVAVGDFAFQENPYLTRVELGSSLQTIGRYAFLDTPRLSSINLPDSVTTIGEGAFFGSSLTNIVIPSGVTKIELGAFGVIDELRQVTMSDGVTAIERQAFIRSPITKLTMSQNIQTIGAFAFYGHQLEQVSIPATTTLIGDRAFAGSTTLTEVIFYGNYSGDFHPESFDENPNLTSIRACPLATGWDGVTFTNGTANISVDNSAPCTSVFSVGGLDYEYTGTAEQEVIVLKCTDDPCYSSDINIPGSVAFNGRTYTVKKIDDGAFCVNDAENPGACDDNSLSQPLTSVVIGENVTIIGETAFFNNRLTRVVIPNSVTTVSQFAFFKNQLIDVVIPNGVRTIGKQAFDANPSLTKLTLGDKVTAIGASAFRDSGLTTVTIPDSVATIGSAAFGVQDSANSKLISVLFNGKYSAAFSSTAFSQDLTIDSISACGDQRGWSGISFVVGPDRNQAVPVSLECRSQEIIFPSIAPQRLSDGSINVSATSTAGLPVTVQVNTIVNPAICEVRRASNSISESFVITFKSEGLCELLAVQAGNEVVRPAVTKFREFRISGKQPQTISFNLPVLKAGESAALTASSTSGLPVTFSSRTPRDCTVADAVVSAPAGFVNRVCAIVASQSGDTTYAAAEDVVRSDKITDKNAQSITFIGPADQAFVDGNLTLSASSSSGLPVTLASATPVSCDVTNSVVTFRRPAECTVVAEQRGDTEFSAAPEVRQSFNITASAQTITFAQPPGQALAAGTLALTGTASSGLPVSYVANPANVCTVANATATLVGAGICRITAVQDGDATFMAAPAVARSFSISVAVPNPVNVAVINADSVQRLYVAYFNRPADPGGFEFYQARLPDGRTALQDELEVVANTWFNPSQEYLSMYAGMSDSQIVNQLYLNIFGRNAEPGGLNFWANALTNGDETVESIALQLSYSAQGDDRLVVNNRIEAANVFTSKLDTSSEKEGYVGNAAAASARSWLALVLATDSSKNTAILGADQAIIETTTAGRLSPPARGFLFEQVKAGIE